LRKQLFLLEDSILRKYWILLHTSFLFMALHTEHRFFSILSHILCSFMSLWIYLLQLGMLEGMFRERSAMLKRSDEPGDGLIL